jgi:predicted Zn-dependent protease
MAHFNPLSLIVAILLAACGNASTPEPRQSSTARNEQRTTAELVNSGREAASRGDAVRAEQYLSLAIEQGADRRQVMPLLLDACLKSSHLRAALNHAEPYLREHPEDDALRYLVANIHVSLGQLVRAKRELGLLLQKDPRNPDAHYLFGILDSGTDLDAARDHFLATAEFTRDEDQRIEVRSRLAELRLQERELARDAERASRLLKEVP